MQKASGNRIMWIQFQRGAEKSIRFGIPALL
jgi:hypothetical protein